MEHAGFLQIPRGAFQAKYASKKPKLEVIQVVQFERGSNEMHWKESNVDEFQSAEFLQRKYVKSLGKRLLQSEKNPWSCHREKKQHFVNLTPIIKNV